MDRQIVYPGQIPLETDLLSTNRNVLVGIGMLALDLLGSSQVTNGLACTQLAVPALSVQVSPGRLYSLQNVDGTAYSSLAADTTHQILKQGILPDAVTLACAAPVTVGYSVNYLIEGTYQDVDSNLVTLPYYNASNPTQAYSGPANSGTSQSTVRKGSVVLQAKAGIAATTGTQTTPAPDAGYIGLYVVTVAYGQSTILNANISTYSGASPIGNSVPAINAAISLLTSRLNGWVNVQDTQWAGGAKGDGVTNDRAAIQAAIATRKTVFFPKPSSFYAISGAALIPQYNSHLLGEEGVTTIIRRTDGAGSVLDFVGSNESAVIEHLRIGGVGCVGITVAGGGYANYLSTLTLNNAHFESDLLQCVNADLIQVNFSDSTFGYYQQFGVNANHQHIVSSFSGTNYTNCNVLTRCKFFNAATGLTSVTFTSGLVLSAYDCRWENNGRDLACSNMQNVLLVNSYSERGKHAVSQFDFGAARTISHVFGGQFNGGAMPAGASMFSANSVTGALLVERADIGTTAAAFAYLNTAGGSHLLPTSGVHHFKDCRVQGNSSDPLLYLDNVIEGAVTSFTPTASGITTAGGTGVSYLGVWSITNRMVSLTIRIAPQGGATTAATAVTSYLTLPANLPVPAFGATGAVLNESTLTTMGAALAFTNGRILLPGWAAQTGNIDMSFTYVI